MPLTARLNGERVVSSLCDDSRWGNSSRPPERNTSAS